MRLKINGKKINIPNGWDQVTFKQYEKFINLKKDSLYEVVALFTGISAEKWEQSQQVENFYLVEKALSWLNDPPDFKKAKHPYQIDIGGKRIIVPQSDDEYIVKEYEDLRATIQMEKKITYKSYPKIAAIFLVRRIFGEYNTKNYKETVKLVKELSLYDVVGMGNFFLKSLVELRNGTNPVLRMWNMIRKKLTQVLRALRYGGSLTRWTT